MTSITDVKAAAEQMQQLIQSPFDWGTERIPGAATDYARLSPEWMNRLFGISSLADGKQNDRELVQSIKFYSEALFRLISLEVAAGAAAERCCKLFYYLAVFASYIPKGNVYSVHSDHAVSFFALARNYTAEYYTGWPPESDYKNESSRVLYALVTGNAVDFTTPLYHDDRLWARLYQAIRMHDREEITAACKDLADYWYSDYEANDVPDYDPEHFPCFEPDCNAIVALVLHREKIPVVFEEEKYRRFYLAALLE